MLRRRSPRPAVGRILISLLVLLLPLSALATEPAPTPATDEVTGASFETWLDGGPRGARVVPEYLGPFNYVREFDQMVSFLADWQVVDPDSVDYGGMIEAESGYLGDVIQTDNTLEAIWCWSRYREFTGSADYDANIAAAWVYCRHFPAWAEEGDPGYDYYRMHNCAWGLTAVLQYEAATGDMSCSGYADTCANYIMARPLNLHTGTVWDQRLNAFCKGWAAGNLYLFGEARGDQAIMDAAVVQGADVLSWINTSPQYYLTYEYWAMSSGTSLWGVCNSVFRDDPVAGQAWLATNAGYMDIWQDWYSVPGYDWDSAWNVAYANAHFAVWDVTGDPAYWQNGVYVTGNLLSLDTDDDGGIVSETTNPVTEDMSWVTSYLVKFGVDRLMGEPPDHDVGVLRFAGLEDGQEIPLGQPVPIRVLATNFGMEDETGVAVHVSGDAGDTTWVRDLAFAALDTLTYRDAWTPPLDGLYVLRAWTDHEGDEEPANDVVTIMLVVGEPTGAPGAAPTGVALGPAEPNPFGARTSFHVALPVAAPVRLTIYDVTGRLVARPADGLVPAGDHVLAWDGRDRDGRAVAAGVYLYRLEAGEVIRLGKIARLR
jgi:hypothetical protein